MSQPPLRHIVRVRSTADLAFVNQALMDEVTINANQLENDVQSAAVCLWRTTVPFSVDPVLWRFQVPAWCRNKKGDNTKVNYARLGAAYAKNTRIRMAHAPLVEVVQDDHEWRTLAANVVDYERTRLLSVPTHLTMFDDNRPLRDLDPSRVLAPALVAFSSLEDHINRLLLEASVAAAGGPVGAQVIVPHDRLLDADALQQLIAAVPTEGVSSYFVWTPKITEELLLSEHAVFSNVVRLISSLAERGVLIGHQYGNYALSAMHDFGLTAMTHHLGWVDHGEPAEMQGFARRSCRTYVPAVRHSLLFATAAAAGRGLDRDSYAERYCECPFCLGVFDELNEHPLDLLLQDEPFVDKRGRTYRIPTGKAVGYNTWHFLWSRHLEMRAFATMPARDVVKRDLERAGLLLDGRDKGALERLEKELRLA